MSGLLARFVHNEQCGLCYDSYNAINIEVLSKAMDREAADVRQIFNEIIQAAIMKHVKASHGPIYVAITGCYFVWKDCGRGCELLPMDEATFRAQMALARARGWIDCIHIEFIIGEDRTALRRQIITEIERKGVERRLWIRYLNMVAEAAPGRRSLYILPPRLFSLSWAINTCVWLARRVEHVLDKARDTTYD
ncbi:hypothetical protein F4679DRAFT_562903 [Xylaria curta]|nr:hypothetical protein F4679DRAFT_562903 [Xylaria curta]